MSFLHPPPYGWRRLRYQDRCALRHAELHVAAERLVEVCRGLGNVHAVYAFGSYARDEIGPESDLDALIIRETDLPMGERQMDIRRLLCGLSTGFDLISL